MPPPTVSRVVALEEAFLHPRVWDLFPEPLQRKYQPVRARLSDVGAERIRLMDAAGIDVQVLSHVQPGVQLLADDQAELAIAVSREVNDWLAEAVAAHPARFAGFAMLPTQSPDHAAHELRRAVVDLGFKGGLINGHTNGRYLDDPSFEGLLAQAESLGVPIYIHPTDPPQPVTDVYYAPFDAALVPTWGWPVETGTHLLRLICAGAFDRHPKLKIIVGHMGELIPFCFTRLNVGLTMAGWLGGATEPEATPMRNNVGYYLRENVFITSSGVFDVPVFDCARAMLGLNNLMFSVDYPFQDNFAAVEFLQRCELSPEDKERFAHGTADELLSLDDRPRHTGASGGLGNKWYRLRSRATSKIGRALISALVR